MNGCHAGGLTVVEALAAHGKEHRIVRSHYDVLTPMRIEQ
jgi:hypothetical protein